jgi:hypothetical protein
MGRSPFEGAVAFRERAASDENRRVHTHWNTRAMANGFPFHHWDLGQCKRGDVWRVELSAAANVFMVDPSNFSKFKRRSDFTHYGGVG